MKPSKKTTVRHTLAELARRFGVAKSTVQGWERRGLSRDWPLKRIEEWCSLNRRDAEPGILADLRKEKMLRQIQILDAQIQRERARLIDREEVLRDAQEGVRIWCEELDAFATDLPPLIAFRNEAEVFRIARERAEQLKRNAKARFAALARGE